MRLATTIMINKQRIGKTVSSLALGVISIGVTLISGQSTVSAQSCNVFGCSAPGAAACNVFGCPAPGAASCDVFGCPAPPVPSTPTPSTPTSRPSNEEANRNERDFRIANRTGRPIESLYLSPSGDTQWGSNDLGEDILRNNRDITFTLRNSSCLYDILAVLSNGQEIEERQVDTCDRSSLSLQ